ncbi:MAG: glycosyltransferase [Deltaproteobacteria bacterium]
MSRIALLGPIHPLRGGIALHTARFAAALRADGHVVRVVSWRRQYPAAFFPGRSQLDPGPPVCDLGEPPPEAMLDSIGPRSWGRVARALAAWQPEFVVLQRWHPFLAPALAWVARCLRRQGAKVVWMVHNARPHEGRAGLWGPILRIGYKAEDLCLTHAASEAVALRGLGVRAAIRTIPHPAPATAPPLDPVAARAALGLPAEGIVFLFFGYVRPYKGVDLLIKALALLTQRPEPWTAVIAGEWYMDRAPAERALAAGGLVERVRIGNRFLPEDELGELFAAASVVVLPYRSGTQSGVVPQAFAHGRPVVVTQVGSVADAVEEGVTGFVVPPENARALADALGLILDGVRFSRAAIEAAHGAASWVPLAHAVVARGVAGAAL